MRFPRPITTRSALILTLAAALAAPVAPARAEEAADSPRRLRRTPVVEAVERAAPAVVSIGTTRLVRVPRFWEWDFVVQERPGALGSGVIVHPNGFVVTNLHVINQAAQISVKLTGLGREDEIPAALVAVDREHDLALLKMDGDEPYPAVTFGRTDDLMVGETVIAMGNPFGLGRTVTVGVLSAVDREIHIRDQVFGGLLQTDAAVNQGNSGGALLNILGEWIGVNSAIYSMSGGSDGISFAIPIDIVREFLVEAMRPRRLFQRWLGVEFATDDQGHVVLGRVYPVGPAADARLRAGLRVVDADGRPITDLVALTLDVLEAASRGTYGLRVADDDGVRAIDLAFESLPTARLSWERLGLRSVEVTPQITEKSGYREGTGVFVSEIREDGPAARLGFQANDLLVGIGEHRVRTQEDLLVLLEGMSSGDAADVHVMRPARTARGVHLEHWKARLRAD